MAAGPDREFSSSSWSLPSFSREYGINTRFRDVVRIPAVFAHGIAPPLRFEHTSFSFVFPDTALLKSELGSAYDRR
jgi:hypothetical protein